MYFYFYVAVLCMYLLLDILATIEAAQHGTERLIIWLYNFSINVVTIHDQSQRPKQTKSEPRTWINVTKIPTTPRRLSISIMLSVLSPTPRIPTQPTLSLRRRKRPRADSAQH